MRYLFLLLSIAAFTADGANYPEQILGDYVRRQPVCFGPSSGPLECEGFVWDTISIRSNGDKLTYVGVDLRFRNGHSCGFYGVGRWRAGFLLASAQQYRDPLKICRLEVRIDGDKAIFRKHSGDCDDFAFCSANGSLDYNGTFVRRGAN